MITYLPLDKQEKEKWLPVLFDLLYANMHDLAPSGVSRQEEQNAWVETISQALEKPPRQILLCVEEGEAVGFFQYYIRHGMLMVEELQLRKDWQRTGLFLGLCRFLDAFLPALETVEAYAHPSNQTSRHLMERLGMEMLPQGESRFLHYRGAAEPIRQRIRRKHRNDI